MRIDSELNVKQSNLKFTPEDKIQIRNYIDMETNLRAQIDAAVGHNADLM
jgi:hypothetical protein